MCILTYCWSPENEFMLLSEDFVAVVVVDEFEACLDHA